MKVLVTGAAGFIGFHASRLLLGRGDTVVGLDNINDYYDPALKHARLKLLNSEPNFSFVKMELEDAAGILRLFAAEKFDRVVHLAAQAGVRYSIENPRAYIDSNIVGTLNILEGCRHHPVEHLVYASSSSVYGLNTSMPFSVHDNVDHPLSLYAATKKSNELMAHTYSNLYEIPTTGLRFFTVYGPWGRPDMALFHFTQSIIDGKTIDVFNYGNHRRDFTYIDDIVDGIVRCLDNIATPNAGFDAAVPDPSTSQVPYRIYNIGNSSPVELNHYIEVIEKCVGKKAIKNLLPLQPGDVPDTYADVTALTDDTGYKPTTSVDQGVARFIEWFVDYYSIDLSKI
jgi:UDP-glucuronate 4-epimerase